MKNLALSDRRRHDRLPVFDVTTQIRSLPNSRVLDLSPGGALVETDQWLTVGGIYAMRLESEHEAIPILGRVVRCRRCSASADGRGVLQPLFQAGIAFELMNPKDAEQLGEMLSRAARPASPATGVAFG